MEHSETGEINNKEKVNYKKRERAQKIIIVMIVMTNCLINAVIAANCNKKIDSIA